MHYDRAHASSPIRVDTEPQIDDLIDRLRVESPAQAPLLMQVVLAVDPYTQGLDVGIKRDRGVLRYSGREWFEGVYSVGELPAEEPPTYFFMDTDTEFPANSELSIDIIRMAVKEFMETDGARPTCLDWQSDE
ncbi:Imm1 family immunity protein [Actinokineospora sp.]|uniref:Imm1 family immunity protein n=1 Tax=Actinokineospora sp. TaxID=1872133 RepID=UPI003D6B1A57